MLGESLIAIFIKLLKFLRFLFLLEFFKILI